ncbi:MAG: RtcB family protein [Deltaproteobacteria bacterium]|nr:RtcB family protein [Deltaproteobacteria bacterium]
MGLGLERIDGTRWRVPRVGKMRVDGLIFADDRLMENIRGDACVQQVANVACLPGIVGHAVAMPDIHWGYGFPIGGVAAFDPAAGGVVSPGGVGYDINCGVRLHTLDADQADLLGVQDAVADALAEAVPAGVGVGRADERVPDLDVVMREGVRALVDAGLVPAADTEHVEDGGRLHGADPAAVGKRARERGAGQLGSLGSGNHFVEVGTVEEILDPAAAAALGLRVGGVTLLVHSGSRGLGHQVCEETVRNMVRVAGRARIDLPDKQLACAPLGSDEAEHYLAAMAAAANFAFANRALIARRALRAVAHGLGRKPRNLDAPLVYDVCHNIAKWEEHMVGGVSRRLCVHRKGATRAFPPGHPALPAAYRNLGQPVIIPGDMGRCSYVLVGQAGSMVEAFGSACHGAGRLLSRSKARQVATPHGVEQALADHGITLRAASRGGVVEEMPEAYKNVTDVVAVVEKAGLARRVARLVPRVVVKG